MKTYLKEVIDIHQVALNLSCTESSILYNTLFDLTSELHIYDEATEDIYIPCETFFEIYASVMFEFMTILINLKH